MGQVCSCLTSHMLLKCAADLLCCSSFPNLPLQLHYSSLSLTRFSDISFRLFGFIVVVYTFCPLHFFIFLSCFSRVGIAYRSVCLTVAPTVVLLSTYGLFLICFEALRAEVSCPGQIRKPPRGTFEILSYINELKRFDDK